MRENSGAYIIDDHNLFSGGMRELVLGLESISAATCFSTPSAALEFDPDYEVKLIVTDYYIPGFDMAEWITKFLTRFERVPLAVVSSSISRADRSTCLDAGASAYFEKQQPPEEVLNGFQRLLARECVALTNRETRIGSSLLTERQIDILVQLARGMNTKQIAKLFELSPETVKSHISAIYKRLGVSGKSDAAEWARSNGFI